MLIFFCWSWKEKLIVNLNLQVLENIQRQGLVALMLVMSIQH